MICNHCSLRRKLTALFSIIFLVTSVFPSTLFAQLPDRPHSSAVKKPLPGSCGQKFCYTFNEEKKLLKVHNAYTFFMRVWPKVVKKIEQKNKQIKLKDKQIKSLKNDLELVRKSREKHFKKRKQMTRKYLEAKQWTPFGDAMPWYIASATAILAGGVIIGTQIDR